MDFRQGICTQCKHSFRVKATSTAHKAKCPKCGGVVEIGEAQSAPSPAAPSGGPAGAKSPASAAHRRTHARHGHKQKQSPVPKVVGGVIAVVVVVVILMQVVGGGDEGPTARASGAAQAKPDLSHVPDATRLEGTTEEEWKEMTDLMAGYLKPPFDKKAERSGDLLIHRGKKAVPAILNGLKRLDISTPEGTDMGWKTQTLLLQSLCNGTNFGWIRDTRPEDVAYNHKVIERWLTAWKEAGGDSEKWMEQAKRGALPASQ